MSSEINKIYRHIDVQRGELLEEQMKVKDELLNEMEAFKLHLAKIEESCKANKFSIDKHAQIIRDYELK
jgi:hypothetical protein